MEQTVIDNRYTIHCEIGHGGNATVFCAYDTINRRLVAIKKLQKKEGDEKHYAMFRQEAMTLAALSHPNIVKIFDFGMYEETPFLVMEYIKGKSLKDIIYENGYLLIDEVVSYMKQILDGLEVCHNAEIVHRDIKPSNIIKKADGTIVLIDFGLAFIHDGTNNLYDEDNKAINGTVYYMAPELAVDSTGSIQSDIYALGVCMFEMLTGRFPFCGSDSQDKSDIFRMHIKNPFPSIRKINSNVPESFERIINKCCMKLPKDRYKNVSELRCDLLLAYKEYKSPQKKKQTFFEKLFRKK